MEVSIKKVSGILNIITTVVLLIAWFFHYGIKLTIIEKDIESIEKSVASIEDSLNIISDLDKRIAIMENFVYKL